MIRPATLDDFAVIESLVMEGAASGGFDSALSEHSFEAALFFERLRLVIQWGLWLRPNPGLAPSQAIPATIWIFEEPRQEQGALGFIAVRSAGRIGYELWLAAIQPGLRGHGLGRQMFEELLTTPIGRKVMVAQCSRQARGGQHMGAILRTSGFQCARNGAESQWLVSPALPDGAKAWIGSAALSVPA